MFKLLPLLWDEVDGEGNDLPGDSDKESVSELKETLSGLLETVSALTRSQAQLQEALGQLANRSTQQTPPEEEEPEPGVEDLESLPRRDFANLITRTVLKAVQKDLGSPLKQSVDALAQQLNEARSTQQVDKFQAGHPDLMEWRGEIAAILKAGRAANVADAYTLVRSENQDKAAKLDKKYNPPTKKDEAQDLFLGFQGFPPNAGSTGSGKNVRMTRQQAAEAAWEEATAAMPGIEKFLGS